jgi:two-component system, LytTR family, sensor kinase
MFEYLFKDSRLWITTGIFLGVFFQFSLDVIFSLIYRNHSIFSPITNYLFSIISSFIIMISLVKLAHWMNRKYAWERTPGNRFYVQIVLITLLVVISIMGLRTLVNAGFNKGGFVRLLDEAIIAGYLLIMSLLLVFADLGFQLLNKWRLSQAEIERFKKENMETRFEMLRLQINPHFLFNSLNTLSSLIYQNQDTASDYVKEMSQVYRYILEKRKAEIVNLSEELDFTRSYIYMLGLRFDEKIKFSLNVDGAYNDKVIVPLTLQILIENAVKHNIISQKKPLKIEIFTQPDSTLVVRNNLQLKADSSYSSGIGLDNIKNRLGFLTDRKLLIETTATDFTVSVPLLDVLHDKVRNW